MPGLWDTHFHREREIRFFADRTNRAQLAYGMTSTLAPGDVAYSSVENREAVTAGTARRTARLRLGRADRRRPHPPGPLPPGSRTWRSYPRDVEDARTRLRLPEDVRAYFGRRERRMVRRGAQVRHPGRDAPHGPGFYVGVDGTAHLAATQRLGYARTVTDNADKSYDDVTAVYANRSHHDDTGRLRRAVEPRLPRHRSAAE